MRTKIQKNLSWLAPYLRAAEKIVPTKRVVEIRGYKVRYRGQDFTEGSILTANFRSYSITLATHMLVKRKTFRRSVGGILQVLAHELAHLRHWDHSPEHWALENRIARKFASVAKRQGVKDMETKPGVRFGT